MRRNLFFLFFPGHVLSTSVSSIQADGSVAGLKTLNLYAQALTMADKDEDTMVTTTLTTKKTTTVTTTAHV